MFDWHYLNKVFEIKLINSDSVSGFCEFSEKSVLTVFLTSVLKQTNVYIIPD